MLAEIGRLDSRGGCHYRFPKTLGQRPVVSMSSGIAVAKGSLDVLVLKALSVGPMHGLEIGTLETRLQDRGW